MALLLAAGSLRAEALGFSAGGSLPGLGSGRIWSLAVDPATPARVLAGTDAGVYVSSDGGATWTLTLPGHQVWSVGFDARHAQSALAGTADAGVFMSGDAGATWKPGGTGLPSQDVRVLAFGLDGVAAGTDAGVGLSADGKTWRGTGPAGYSIAALAVAANAPQLTLVAGADNGNISGASVFRSKVGAAWQPVQSGLPASAVVSSISAGPIDQAVPQRPLVVATSKGVFRSGDGGTTWSSSAGVPDSVLVTTVTFDPLDPTVVYAGADGAGSTGGGFMRSTDGGLTFSSMTGGLNAKNVEAIAVAPTNPPTVLVAIDPPTGGASVYTLSDSTVPAPPTLVPEAPGAPVPTVVATPTPSPSPSHAATRPPPSSPPSGFSSFAQSAFHWPIPLVYEIIFVLLIAYVFVRWRQRYYIEGPP